MSIERVGSLTVDQMIKLLERESRLLFLGTELFDKCEANGNKLSKEDVEKRLNYWKDHDDFNAFQQCSVEDIKGLCNFKDATNVKYNPCYQSLYRLLEEHKDYLQEHSKFSVDDALEKMILDMPNMKKGIKEFSRNQPFISSLLFTQLFYLWSSYALHNPKSIHGPNFDSYFTTYMMFWLSYLMLSTKSQKEREQEEDVAHA